MNLIIDIGNTRLKAGIFKNSELVETFVFENAEAFENKFIPASFGVSKIIVCSVVADFAGITSPLFSQIPILEFTQHTAIPIKNEYLSKSSLGLDRLAAATGAAKLFPDCNLLNIDTGTCIKYNFIATGSTFLGGGISPGLQMRLTALHSFTSGLPLVKLQSDYNDLIGKDTTGSILSGAILGALAEVEQIIFNYLQNYPDLKVVLSGGDSDFFAKRLKSSIFARPNLVLEGLNEILEYNA